MSAISNRQRDWMAPKFALFLSPEGIALAHRQPAGHWAVLGDTALDVPDLGASLLVLRKLAEARAGKDFETLVVLPDDQVLYTSLTAPGPEDSDRLEQIRAGLDGLTPYPVDSLAFDWFALEDGRVKLAVVAQETLEEARQFATQHGFTPAGFGARPLDSRFRGVAHFDRSPDWVADLDDIEFGHDTWHPPQDEDEPAPEDTAPAKAEDTASARDTASILSEVVEDFVEQQETKQLTPAEPPVISDTAETAVLPVSSDLAEAAGETELESDTAMDAPPDQNVEKVDTATPRASGRLHLAPAAGDEAGTDDPIITADQPEETSEEDAPLQVPAGFGARRARQKEPSPADQKQVKRKRKGRNQDTPPPDTGPQLPRSLPADSDNPETPTFGRSRKGETAPDQAGPLRPPGAGPEPKLPPLARLKSELQTRGDRAAPDMPKTRFSKDPFSNRAVEADTRPTFKDRIAGVGRQLSEGTGKARDAASGLSGRVSGGGLKGRLKSLTERKTETGGAEGEIPSAPPSVESPQTSDSSKPGRKKRRASKSGGDQAPEDTAALAVAIQSKAPKPEEIAPPPAKAGRRARFTPPKRRGEPQIAEADAPIMGGLLARGSVATQRGPSIRAGLIMTLILLAVLGLVALWAAFYLPDTTIGRWMGFGTDEEPAIVAETEPGALDTPGLTGDAPAAEDAPVELARVPAALETPAPLMVAPEAPVLLPDIDADLDLEPAAVPAIDPELALPSPDENANFYARTGIWQRPPVLTTPETGIDTGDLIFAGLDPPVTMHDAVALGPAGPLPRTELAALLAIPVTPEAGVPLRREDLVEPSPDGTLSPYGIRIFAGQPPVPAQPRPNDNPAARAAASAEAAAAPAVTDAPAEQGAADTAVPSLPAGAVNLALLQGVRPESRPEDLQERRERALLGGVTLNELAAIRPEGRPASVQELAAEAAAASAPDIAGASDLAVAASSVPATRPANIAELVAAARAAGHSGPQSSRPSATANASDTIEIPIPSEASVTRAATEENAINLREINLIGVSGAPSERRALIRMPTGRFLTVEVGDRLDGGQVAAIGESSLQYVKHGRTHTLEVPTG